MTLPFRSSPLLLVALTAVAACSAASSADGPPREREEPEPRVVALRGAYLPASGGEGKAPFASFVVESDTRYRLRARGCADASCEERGSYRLDMKTKSMTLEVEGSRRTYAIAFDVVTAPSLPTGAPPESSALTPRADKLVESQSTLIEASTVLLDGEPYSNDDTIPRCDASPIFVGSSWSVVSDERAKDGAREDALAKCKAAACYQPGAPRKFLRCYIRHSECKAGKVYTTCEAYASGE